MTFLPGPSSNLRQASLPSPALACSGGKGSECQLEMPQAAGLDGARCTSDESESTWTFAQETLQALVTSANRCMCCFAREVLASACVSHFRNEEDTTEIKMKFSLELPRRMDNCKERILHGSGKGRSTCLVTWW